MYNIFTYIWLISFYTLHHLHWRFDTSNKKWVEVDLNHVAQKRWWSKEAGNQCHVGHLPNRVNNCKWSAWHVGSESRLYVPAVSRSSHFFGPRDFIGKATNAANTSIKSGVLSAQDTREIMSRCLLEPLLYGQCLSENVFEWNSFQSSLFSTSPNHQTIGGLHTDCIVLTYRAYLYAQGRKFTKVCRIRYPNRQCVWKNLEKKKKGIIGQSKKMHHLSEMHPLIKTNTKGTISKLNFITQLLKISGDMLVFGGSTSKKML